MAYEDFTTYDETDEGSNVTVISNKISWNDLDRDETSHVSDSKDAAHFNDDFEHLFECQFSDVTGGPWISFWTLANLQLDQKALILASEDFITFFHYAASTLYLRVYENGSIGSGPSWSSAVLGTTYYVTLSYDRDGGANSTGQYVAEIRTGSHTGTLQITLTADCSVGEQNDFEYIFGLASYDDNQGVNTADGFTQNLDLQEAVPPEFVGSSGAISTVLGSLDSQPGCVGSAVETAGADGSLDSQPGCSGFVAGVLGAFGFFDTQPECVGIITGISGVDGSLSFLEVKIEGFIEEISGADGSLDSQPRLYNSGVAGFLDVKGSIKVAISLIGFADGIVDINGWLGFLIFIEGFSFGISNIIGVLYTPPLGFYESLANSITTYFQDIAVVNNLTVRYDNDPRSTPTNVLWCECGIEFGTSEQKEIGGNSYRNHGDVTIKLKNLIGLGTSRLLQKADVIVTAFEIVEIEDVIFRTPRIVKIGRVEDNFQINVICPFFVDKVEIDS